MTTISTVVAKMGELSNKFAIESKFDWSLVQLACKKLNMTPDEIKKTQYTIRRNSQSLEWGTWFMPESLKNNEVIITASQPRTKQIQPQPILQQEPMNHNPKLTIPQTTETIIGGVKIIQHNTPEIPFLDTKFVPYGNYKDLEKIIKSRMFYPTFITGHSGNGKSSQVLHICAKHKIPVIRINMNKMCDEEKLIGCNTLVAGEISAKEGPVLTAMRVGAILLIDELSAGDTNLIMSIMSILEGKPYYFALTGEYVKPAPGFNIIATDNTKGRGSSSGRYIGTNILNDAFLERFAVTFEQEFPSQTQEKKMVINWMNDNDKVDEQFAEDLTKWAEIIRKSFKEGSVDDLISTRRLEQIVKAWTIFDDKVKAITLCTNRFDELTATAFVELFDKMSNVQSTTPDPVATDAKI